MSQHIPEEIPSDEVEQESPQKKPQVWRWIALLLLLVGLFFLAKELGLAEFFDKNKLRQAVESAGYWGFALFFGIFIIGELLHVPGMVFVAAGVYAYGTWIGGALVLVGAILSVSVSFWVVRGVGGQALTQIRWKRMEQLLAKLDEKPIRVVIALRILFWLAPPVNYALAMSSIRFRDFLIGSTVGLTPVIVAAIVFLDWLL